jgi:hypothetical protein
MPWWLAIFAYLLWITAFLCYFLVLLAAGALILAYRLGARGWMSFKAHRAA